MIPNKNQKLCTLHTMLRSRYCDLVEQRLVRQGKASFHVSAMGHEALASLLLPLRDDDLLFTYYRDRALILGRGVSVSALAADFFGRLEGLTRGRQMPCHFSSRDHGIWSVATPTASQLLPACGAAWGMKMDSSPGMVIATVGDASTRQGDFYEAVCFALEHELPVLFVVEDNGYGISTPTGKMHALSLGVMGSEIWKEVNGLDPDEIFEAGVKAIENIREGGGPRFIWCRMERISDHTNSDDHRVYRSAAELAALSERDPLERYKKKLLEGGTLNQNELSTLEEDVRCEVEDAYDQAESFPIPSSAMLDKELNGPPWTGTEQILHPERFHLLGAFRKTLDKALGDDPTRIVFGQDVEDPKGGVFTLTKGLSSEYPDQVFNSPLAESTILGIACGLASYGKRPIVEIQFIDFIHVGWNQLVSNLATLRWRTCGEWQCPVVIYAPYGAYIPGGGLWHSQSNESAIAHFPGINVVVPSCPEDAAGLLWSAMNTDDPTVVLLPKHLFWKETSAANAIRAIPLGQATVRREGRDITVVAWGNCIEVVEEAALLLSKQIDIEIIDLRSIVPWDVETVVDSVCKTGRLLIVQEDSENCSVGQMIISTLSELPKAWESLTTPPRLLSKGNVMIGFSPAYEFAALPTTDKVLNAIVSMLSLSRKLKTEELKYIGNVVPGAFTEAFSSILVPVFGEGIRSATVLCFHKEPGDAVESGENVAEMETDKAVFSISAQEKGILKEWMVGIGEQVLAGQEIGRVSAMKCWSQ